MPFAAFTGPLVDEIGTITAESGEQFAAQFEADAEAVADDVVEAAADALESDEAFEAALQSAVEASQPSMVPESEDVVAAPVDVAVAPVEDDDEDDIVAADVEDIFEAMRPMISDLIRQELQGELGERITRNVRKLVRQEIKRAMTVRDVE